MILQNQIRCGTCRDEPFSATRHDYKECRCGKVAVDGGTSYLRRTFNGPYEDISIEIPEKAGKAAIEAIENAIRTNRNSYGILCAVARTLRDHGVKFGEVT